MPLDVATQPRFLTSLLGGVVLLAMRDEPVVPGMFDRLLLCLVSFPGMKLLQDFVSRLLPVPAFSVILWALLVSVIVMHQSPFFDFKLATAHSAIARPPYNLGSVTPRWP